MINLLLTYIQRCRNCKSTYKGFGAYCPQCSGDND